MIGVKQFSGETLIPHTLHLMPYAFYPTPYTFNLIPNLASIKKTIPDGDGIS